MTADRLPPLLRAPPFPGIAPATAMVSESASPVDPAMLDPSEVDSVLDGVRVARVGGAFWAAPAQERVATILRAAAPGAPADALRLPAGSRRGEAVDPWSLLAPGIELVARGDDEWAAIGAIIDADVRLVAPGRFGAPGEGRATRRARVAARLLGRRYRDPFTGAASGIEDTIALLALWREQIDANRAIAAAAGMAWWKRAEIRRFLWAPRLAPLRFARAKVAVRHAARQGGALAVWPSRVSSATLAQAARRRVPVITVEDGFIRSVGLGVHLVPPQSVAIDPLGIHYDPAAPSSLETLLSQGDPSPALLARARRLRETIVARGIGKYGAGAIGAGTDDTAPRPTDRRLVLVPGQVEDDRSVLLGGGDVAGNLELLRRVRAAEPGADIWFRPHPDVDAGHRRGAVADADVLAYADRVVRGGGMAALLGRVDAVHVLTSLTGFEALLRGLEVTCHGVPFFAGWGLTRDLMPVPVRRGRALTLDALVAAALIRYPRYLDPVTGLPCPVEVLVDRLDAAVPARASWLTRLRTAQSRLLRRR